MTYRCNYDCVHCYCQGLKSKEKELATASWKKILDQIQQAGCLWVGLTGGDPLTRPDFLDIYSYSKKKGFLINVLTNGFGLTDKIIKHFALSPPRAVEITVNGITKKTYESITRRKDAFAPVMENIKKLKKHNILCYIKANCLTLNSREIPGIKKWVDGFFGKQSGYEYYFSFDPVIFPKLNGNLDPCKYRITYRDTAKIYQGDPDLKKEYKALLSCEFPKSERPSDFLYQCSSWKNQFIINPFGKLKFCSFTDKFSSDLKKVSFKEGFFRIFPRILEEKFKTPSRCKTCRLRVICNWCPAKAHLETGCPEQPVPYYCYLARETYKNDRLLKRGKNIIR